MDRLLAHRGLLIYTRRSQTGWLQSERGRWGAAYFICAQRVRVSFEGDSELFETLNYILHPVDEVRENNLAVGFEFDGCPWYFC